LHISFLQSSPGRDPLTCFVPLLSSNRKNNNLTYLRKWFTAQGFYSDYTNTNACSPNFVRNYHYSNHILKYYFSKRSGTMANTPTDLKIKNLMLLSVALSPVNTVCLST